MTMDRSQQAFDLTELSDRAWSVIDPLGLYEEEKRRWVTAIAPDGTIVDGLSALCDHLGRVADAIGSPHDPVPARLIVLVMTFLAAHPETHDLSDGVLRDAIAEAYPAGRPAPEIAAFLARRAELRDARNRSHGATEPRHRYRAARPPSDRSETTSSGW